MAFDISKFDHLYDFEHEVESVGTLHCRSLNSEQERELTKAAKNDDVSGESLARQLLAHVARAASHEQTGGGPDTEDVQLPAEILARVTMIELEGFCDEFLGKNRWLSSTHDGEDLRRVENENALDFLKRVLRHHAAERRRQSDRLLKSVSGSLFADTTLDSMRRNLSISDQLKDTIAKYTRGLSATDLGLAASQFDVLNRPPPEIRMPDFRMPENPIHETNKKLGSVVDQIEDLRPMAAQAAQLIRSMNDAAIRMQADYIANAASTGRQTRIAIWIAAVSLFVSAVGLGISSFFSYQSYVDAKVSGGQADAQIKAFQAEIRALTAAQRNDQAAIAKAIMDAQRAAVVPSVKK